MRHPKHCCCEKCAEAARQRMVLVATQDLSRELR